MKKLCKLWQTHRRPLIACLIAAVGFAVAFLIWLGAVRPQAGKCYSVKICDNYENFYTVEQSVTQTFSTDFDVMNLTFMFETVGGQPKGDLEVILSDPATGEVLSTSTGVMANIISGQYTGLGMSALAGGERVMRQYQVTLIPHYETEARLAVGCSAQPVNPAETLVLDGETLDSTLAQYISSAPIGRFLSLYYWGVALALIAILCLCWLLVSGRRFRLEAATFVLVVLFGLVFTAVLPPYSVPDEQFHINESFTVASWWANRVSGDEWKMGDVPIFYSYRRPSDFNSIIEDERTSVFTWKEYAYHLTDTTTDALGDHVWLFEAQADTYPLLYAVSALGVFLGFCLHLGFAPTLLLGRVFDLLAFAGLAALAVKKTPFAKPAFLGAALLPMTLHLAASFSRDSMLLGCSFLFTALCLDAAYGPHQRLGLRQLLPLALLALLIAPAKVVYYPLIALCLLIPAARLGGKQKALACKAGLLSLCALLLLWHNGYILQSSAVTSTEQTTVEQVHSQIQQEYDALLEATGEESVLVEGRTTTPAAETQTEAAQAAEETAGETLQDDSICYTLSYCLAHPMDTVLLCVRSVIELGDHYVKTLVGGNLSYYSLELAWTWVLLLYGLLLFAALPQPGAPVLTGLGRGWAGLVALGCAGLALLGCICWTPTYYTTIYGFQGRYLLPMLPLALAALRPGLLQVRRDHAPALTLAFAAVDACVVLNIILAILAR